MKAHNVRPARVPRAGAPSLNQGAQRMKIAVIGAGSWRTTLADLLAKKGVPTTLWVREPNSWPK